MLRLVSRRVVLITGASTGIGAAAALALAEAGFEVLAGVRDEGAGERLRAAAADGAITPIRLDVTAPAEIAAARAQVEARCGERGLWGLVNNAGIAVAGPLEFLPVEDLRRQLEVNVVAQVAVTQAFLPVLRRARGRVVITGSDSGIFGAPLLGAYAMSKFAMEALADVLRRELRPWGIKVALLEPGVIATEIWGRSLADGVARLEAGPAEQRDLYGPLITRVIAQAERDAQEGSPPALIARDVVHALSARRPRTRYLSGRNARLTGVLARLPDRWLDALVARLIRW